MYTINDSMFALMLRFIDHKKEIAFSDHDFIQKQLREIEGHINNYPVEERGERAIEWIEKHAANYRKRWENDIIGKEVSNKRCPDCPLAETNGGGHCEIHEQWLELLDQYVTDKINSRKYVENGLKLLADHKEDLKIKRSRFNEDKN
ncbi:MAG: hypothetical protein OEV42_09255 [Deltaproteobacteria bacterium]|nr:hypothetical protein [Deltaproteobacteria bacterium]